MDRALRGRMAERPAFAVASAGNPAFAVASAGNPAFAVASAGNPAFAIASARKPRWTEPLTITGGVQNLCGLYRVLGVSGKGAVGGLSR